MTTIDASPRSLRPGALHEILLQLARLRIVEPEVVGLQAVIRPGDHVFDVGAGYGMYSFPLAHLVGGSGRVHSFEPQSHQGRVLRLIRRLSRSGQINITKGALGAGHGEHSLVLPTRFGIPIHGHAHVAEGVQQVHTPSFGSSRNRTTTMTTIDSWCAANDVGPVSFIKIDVEGFEPDVLDGTTDTIDTWRPSLLLEIEDRHVSRYGRDANQFAGAILDRWPEYGMYTWSGSAWRPADRVRLGVRNYLFATKSALSRGGTVETPATPGMMTTADAPVP
ncbi:FkbM family methyltransferase, partial [Arthrobacter sp. H14]|uniref:FkbM family methyltransferase n=1 Tax=Arthrobacter sp. H14 TaxID=1312959 RepID=UPI0006884DFF